MYNFKRPKNLTVYVRTLNDNNSCNAQIIVDRLNTARQKFRLIPRRYGISCVIPEKYIY